MFLHDEDVAAWLQALTDKQFVEFFYKHLSARQIDYGGQPTVKSHLALAEVVSMASRGGGFRKPVVELLCASPLPTPDDAPIKHRATCCGFQTGSYRRHASCPVCGEEVGMLEPKPYRYTIRIWKDGELLRHRCLTRSTDDAAAVMLTKTMLYPAMGCEIRLYRGTWREHENIPIEHLACEELVDTEDFWHRAARFGHTRESLEGGWAL